MAGPLIRLGTDGTKAPVLNYNVPESVSFSGRNFMELQFDDNNQIFKKSILSRIESKAVLGTPTLPTMGQSFRDKISYMAGEDFRKTIIEEMKLGFSNKMYFPYIGQYAGVIRLVEKPNNNGFEVISNLPLSSELSNLSPDEVVSAMLTSKSLMIYRSVSGSLTYDYVTNPDQTLSSTGTGFSPIAIGRGGSGSLALLRRVRILSPANNEKISGPSSGVTINMKGTAPPALGDPDTGIVALTNVEVTSDEPSTFQVRPDLAGDWSKWSATGSIKKEGIITLTAKAIYEESFHEEATIKINVLFTTIEDNTAPTVDIVYPEDGTFIDGPTDNLPIYVTGTASDNKKVDSVSVQFGEKKSSQIADQASAAGDWSKWSATSTISQADVSAGGNSLSITATAKDQAGNTAEKTVRISVSFPTSPVIKPHLFLIEEYRLSSFLGDYGAGRTINTFTLLPGEKMKISIRTYKKKEIDAKNSSSVLDSVTDESSKDFESTLATEQSDKKGYQKTFSYEINAKAHGQWGFNSIDLSGGVKGGTNSTREEFAKNVSNATQKTTSKASSKRDVQVNTSYEEKEEEGQETSVEREIQNINVSRTLNFVFRQMNQKFITLLHLVDARVAFWDGDPNPNTSEKVELPLYQLDRLKNYIKDDTTLKKIRDTIIGELQNIYDYNDVLATDFITDSKGYWHVDKNREALYNNSGISVPGVILAANEYIMRTDGVIVEAVLGQGDALDDYSQGLQKESVASKQLANKLTVAEIAKNELANKIVEDNNEAGGKLFNEVFPCCKPTIFSLWPPKDNDKLNGDISG
jgi:hypothetical protein